MNSYRTLVKEFVGILEEELSRKRAENPDADVEKLREAIAFTVFEEITEDLRQMASPGSLGLITIFIINQVLENATQSSPTATLVKVSGALNSHPNFSRNVYSPIISSRYQAIGEFAAQTKLPPPVFLAKKEELSFEEQVEEMKLACEQILLSEPGATREMVGEEIFSTIFEDLKAITEEHPTAQEFVSIIESAMLNEPSFEVVISNVNEEIPLELGGAEFERVRASFLGIQEFLKQYSKN